MKECCKGKKSIFRRLGRLIFMTAVAGGGYYAYTKFFKK